MSETVAIVSRIEAYCAKHGLAETTFGRFAVNDGKLVSRLRGGGSITLDTLSRIDDALKRRPAPSRKRKDAA